MPLVPAPPRAPQRRPAPSVSTSTGSGTTGTGTGSGPVPARGQAAAPAGTGGGGGGGGGGATVSLTLTGKPSCPSGTNLVHFDGQRRHHLLERHRCAGSRALRGRQLGRVRVLRAEQGPSRSVSRATARPTLPETHTYTITTRGGAVVVSKTISASATVNEITNVGTGSAHIWPDFGACAGPRARLGSRGRPRREPGRGILSAQPMSKTVLMQSLLRAATAA